MNFDSTKFIYVFIYLVIPQTVMRVDNFDALNLRCIILLRNKKIIELDNFIDLVKFHYKESRLHK